MSILRELTLEITRECVNDCLHCSSTAVPLFDHSTIKLSALLDAIREAVDLGLTSISISGGEPFVSPYLVPVLDTCRKLGIPNTLIYTSGIVRDTHGVASPLSAEMIENVRRVGATLIFSIHSTDPQIHDRIVGFAGRLSNTLDSMQKALNAGIPIECHIVPNHLNIPTLVSSARELIKVGAKCVSFLRLVPQGYAAQNLKVLSLFCEDEVEMKSAFTQLMADEDSECIYRFGVPFGDVCGHVAHCYAGISKLIMRWDGIFLPCEAFKECGNPEFYLGELGTNNLCQILQRANKSLPLHKLKKQSWGIDSCPAQYLYYKK